MATYMIDPSTKKQVPVEDYQIPILKQQRGFTEVPANNPPAVTANSQGQVKSTGNVGTTTSNASSPFSPTVQSTPVPGSQASHQAWINNPASGQGGMDAYIAKQQQKYDTAFANNDWDMLKKLQDDRQRVGYSLDDSKYSQNKQMTQPDYSWINNFVNNEVATSKQAIDQELARLKQQYQFSADQNNTFLQDQIKRLNDQKAQTGQDIINFQNRRGGFYSGGVDFQMANNEKAYGQASSDLTRDVQTRNADIWNNYNQLASQAAEKVALLTSQAPDRIRQLIEEQKGRDAQYTGMYNGSPTKEMQNQQFNQNMATQEQQLKETQIMAQLTGRLPDGTPTNDYQQQILKNAWDTINQIGYVPANLASVVGVPAGTRTLEAKQIAISQQNANTSALSASNTQSNQQFDNFMKLWEVNKVAPYDFSYGGTTIAKGTPFPSNQKPVESSKLDPKDSAINYSDLTAILDNGVNPTTGQRLTKEEKRQLVEANRDNLTDSDFRKALDYVK